MYVEEWGNLRSCAVEVSQTRMSSSEQESSDKGSVGLFLQYAPTQWSNNVGMPNYRYSPDIYFHLTNLLINIFFIGAEGGGDKCGHPLKP